ncbi:MAG: TRAP transporter permease [Oscillospiraceae bacterium]|nr:TRAP transporter permease [Oscillospiraceae bacterium]
MKLFKKKVDEVPVVDTAAETGGDMTAELDAVMRKYDRESATRIWEGVPKIVMRVLMAAFSIYCIGMTLFSVELPETKLARFLGFIIILGYLTYPAKKGSVRVNYVPWYDIVLMVLGAGCFLYFAFNAMSIIKLATMIEVHHVVIGVVGLLVLAELCRRCVGLPILCVLGVLLVYTFYNQMSWNFGFLSLGENIYQSLHTIIYKLFYTTSGVIGTPVNVCYTYIVLFIIFGAFLERTGIANFFIAVANKVAGWSSGGPAKVAVISSALCGMVSGSSVGNTVTTGSVTIPMMKKTGYKPEFAGAVEAAASTGGQIMPPIMGAAAFLMAEYMDLPYMQVAVKAILPAVLYFAGIFIAVHLEAKKLGLKGISKDELPKWGGLVKKVYLIIPLVLLVWMVSTGMRTMQFSAAIAIAAAVVVGFLNGDERLTFGKIVEALEAGAKGAITVAVACGMAGLIAGCITVTGLASTLINAIVTLSGNTILIGLVLTMLCCIVLGMGVPTTANYCIMASTCAPILIQLGLAPVAAHFFVFYFGIVADITPPVALAAYAGSAIAKANPMKTGFNATKLAIAAFIVPYIFAYSPAMLFEGVTGIWPVLQIGLSSVLGIFGIAAALNGHLIRHIPVVFRVVLAVGGLCMMIPGALTDVIGLAVVALIITYQYFKAKAEAKSAD